MPRNYILFGEEVSESLWTTYVQMMERIYGAPDVYGSTEGYFAGAMDGVADFFADRKYEGRARFVETRFVKNVLGQEIPAGMRVGLFLDNPSHDWWLLGKMGLVFSASHIAHPAETLQLMVGTYRHYPNGGVAWDRRIPVWEGHRQDFAKNLVMAYEQIQHGGQ